MIVIFFNQVFTLQKVVFWDLLQIWLSCFWNKKGAIWVLCSCPVKARKGAPSRSIFHAPQKGGMKPPENPPRLYISYAPWASKLR